MGLKAPRGPNPCLTCGHGKVLHLDWGPETKCVECDCATYVPSRTLEEAGK